MCTDRSHVGMMTCRTRASTSTYFAHCMWKCSMLSLAVTACMGCMPHCIFQVLTDSAFWISMHDVYVLYEWIRNSTYSNPGLKLSVGICAFHVDHLFLRFWLCLCLDTGNALLWFHVSNDPLNHRRAFPFPEHDLHKLYKSRGSKRSVPCTHALTEPMLFSWKPMSCKTSQYGALAMVFTSGFIAFTLA